MLTRLKNIALFLAAPFIGLAYIIALPFVGFYYIIRLSMDGIEKKIRERKIVPRWYSMNHKSVKKL